MKNNEKEKGYKILAEIYNEDNKLIRYIIINNKGIVMDVKKEILEKWN